MFLRLTSTDTNIVGLVNMANVLTMHATSRGAEILFLGEGQLSVKETLDEIIASSPIWFGARRGAGS